MSTSLPSKKTECQNSRIKIFACTEKNKITLKPKCHIYIYILAWILIQN